MKWTEAVARFKEATARVEMLSLLTSEVAEDLEEHLGIELYEHLVELDQHFAGDPSGDENGDEFIGRERYRAEGLGSNEPLDLQSRYAAPISVLSMFVPDARRPRFDFSTQAVCSYLIQAVALLEDFEGTVRSRWLGQPDWESYAETGRSSRRRSRRKAPPLTERLRISWLRVADGAGALVPQLGELSRMVKMRNLVVHNQGFASEWYLNRWPADAQGPDHALRLNVGLISHFGCVVRGYANALYPAVAVAIATGRAGGCRGTVPETR